MSHSFVSRAGHKLQFALDKFPITIKGKVCADLGTSTGGFTDCLLKNGAKKVYAVDTAYGTLDWKLRQDPRVVVMERTNALHLTLPKKVDFISIDVGWTPQKLILPVALTLLKPHGNIVSLLKPHYEAPPKWIKKGKLKSEFLPPVLEKVKQDLKAQNISITDLIPSPLVGERAGNPEYLLWIKAP